MPLQQRRNGEPDGTDSRAAAHDVGHVQRQRRRSPHTHQGTHRLPFVVSVQVEKDYWYNRESVIHFILTSIVRIEFAWQPFSSRGLGQRNEVPRRHGPLPVCSEEAAGGEHREHQGFNRRQPERRGVPLQGGLTGFTLLKNKSEDSGAENLFNF